MKSLAHRSTPTYGIVIATCALLVLIFSVVFMSRAQAASAVMRNGERLITIHENGQERGILTHASTLRQAFQESHIEIDPRDKVEPGLDETLIASNYEVNVYRARPVIIADGAIRQKIMTPHQTAKQIAKDAGITLQDEDIATISANTNMVSEGAGVQMTIKRATAFTFLFYGTKTASYTQAKTVADMLKQKNITLGKDDTLSVPLNAKIQSGMTVELWRNGVQTATIEEEIAFETEKIQDADQPVGYHKVKTPGVPGKKTVTYEIEMKNGKEVARKEIQSVVTKESTKQIETVGVKPTFTGDFAAALAKLRSCEGGYNSWNPAGPYYGAYQFNESTWKSVTSAPYGSATPAEQDQAAYQLYLRRGWRPWPNCGRGLPDTYR